MPTVSRIAALALALACAVALSGCDPADPEPSPSPSATAEPVFASEEEALAAATEAYAAYQAVSDTILSQGGADASRMETVAAGEALEESLKSAKNFESSELRSEGRTAFSNLSVQQLDLTGASIEPVTAYVCVDVSTVDVLNSAGESVVADSRPSKQAYAVGFAFGSIPEKLLVSRAETWANEGICVD